MTLERFAIEAPFGLPGIVQFDTVELDKLGYPSPLRKQVIEALLLWRCRVPDAWRYVVQVKKGKVKLKPPSPGHGRRLRLSAYHDVSVRHSDRRLPVIVLVLESPHKDEYRLNRRRNYLVPKGPAQAMGGADAGGAIAEYGPGILEQLVVLKGLANGEYALLIVNPVPYLTSLHWLGVLTGKVTRPEGKLNKDVRNHVWNQLWALQWMQADFLSRIASYAPAAVLNCCTSKLRRAVTSALCRAGYGPVSVYASHPAVTWQTGKPGGNGRPVKVRSVSCKGCRC